MMSALPEKTASTAASVISKMAKVADFVDPAALAINGAMRLGGAGIGSLDNILWRLGANTANSLLLPDMPLVAATPTAAMRPLDDAGADSTASRHVSTTASRSTSSHPPTPSPPAASKCPPAHSTVWAASMSPSVPTAERMSASRRPYAKPNSSRLAASAAKPDPAP